MSHELTSNNKSIGLYCVVNLINNKVSIVLLSNCIDVIMYRLLYVLAVSNTLVIQRQPIKGSGKQPTQNRYKVAWCKYLNLCEVNVLRIIL